MPKQSETGKGARNTRWVGSAGLDRPGSTTRAKHVSDLVGTVLNDVVRRRSGMTIDLIAGWQDIVGPDYAGFTQPEKIAWPRRSSDAEPFRPGMLVVACEGAKALFFQHETGQILEKVNFFFGFEAVDRIKIVQKPVKPAKPDRTPANVLAEPEKVRLQSVLDRVTDPQLRERLEKFGTGVISRRRREKHLK